MKNSDELTVKYPINHGKYTECQGFQAGPGHKSTLAVLHHYRSGMQFRVFLFIFNFIIFSVAATNLELFLKQNTKIVNKELINITVSIIDKIFLKSFSEVNFIAAVKNSKNAHFLDIKDALLTANDGSTTYRIFDQKYNHSSEHEKKRNVVVLIDTHESFTPLIKSFKQGNFDRRSYFLFVLINETMQTQGAIFHLMAYLKIMNTNVIYAVNRTTIIIKTFQPFHAKSCVTISEETLAKIQNGDFKGNWKDLYPVKTKNFYGCPLRVAFPNDCPSLCIAEVKGKKAVVGYDVPMLDMIAKKLNFDLRLIFVNGSLHGESGVETLNFLAENKADIALHSLGLTQPERREYDHSMVYLTMPMVFVVPPGELLGFFEKILQPFEPTIWILLLITFFVAVVIIFLLKWKFRHILTFFHEKKTGSAMMNFLAAILGLGQTNLPTRNSPRIILLSFLIFCLILRNVYQGVLFDLMQSDGRHKEVQTVEELISKKYEIFMQESAENLAKNFPNIYNRYYLTNLLKQF